MGLTGQAATVDELLTGRENIRLIGGLSGLSAPVHQARRRRPARAVLAHRRRRPGGQDLLRRHAPPPRPRGQPVAAPPVLFLDEPTTGLDPRSRNELWDVLRGLVRDGTTLLLTTQYLEEADQLADDIVVIDKGKVIARGHADAAEGPGRPGQRRRDRDPRRRPAARRGAAARGCVDEVHVDAGARRLTAQAGGLRDMTRIGERLRRQRHRASTTSGSSDPASTTCSCT